MDAARVKNENIMMDKLARTLELLYAYEVDNQPHPFKSMLKMTVRRTVTNGVAYVKLGYERVMEQRPDEEKGIADASERLATLERLAADHPTTSPTKTTRRPSRPDCCCRSDEPAGRGGSRGADVRLPAVDQDHPRSRWRGWWPVAMAMVLPSHRRLARPTRLSSSIARSRRSAERTPGVDERQLDVAHRGRRGSRWKVWKTKPISRLRISASSSSVRRDTSWSRRKYWPDVGVSRQPMQVHQRRLARARRPHDRGVLVRADHEVDAVHRAHFGGAGVVDLAQLDGPDDLAVATPAPPRRRVAAGADVRGGARRFAVAARRRTRSSRPRVSSSGSSPGFFSFFFAP